LSTVAGRIPAALARLTRRRDEGIVGGVCAGLAHAARVDATLVRLVFALLSFAGGAGILAYAAAWLGLPAEGNPRSSRRRRWAALILLGTATIVSLRAVGVAGSVLWPSSIVAAGIVLALHRPTEGARWKNVVRAPLALGLAIVGSVLLLNAAADSNREDSLVAPSAVLVVLFLVVGPWVWRLLRERETERSERIRAEERADMAARVHDSVLQTLALVQRSAGDPRRVAALARRQERELRGWLYGGTPPSDETLSGALQAALADIEELHGVAVELVQTGDAPLDDRLGALVLAAREAVANAAAHAGVDEVDVFADADTAEARIFVRDRGIGFVRSEVPAGRHGIAESIEARMTRQGGSATLRSAPGEGTEVELRLPLAAL